MHKIGVIGDKNTILAFKAFGFDIYEAHESTPELSRRLVDKMAKDGYGMIFITEQIAATIEETMNRYTRQAIPAIVPVPGNSGSLGIGMAKIRSNVEKAVGINILD